MRKVECFVSEDLDRKKRPVEPIRGWGRWPQAGQSNLWERWNSMESRYVTN